MHHEPTAQARRHLYAADTAIAETPDLPSPKRHITTRNQVTGGLLLHQTRAAEHVICGGRFAGKLAVACGLASSGHSLRGVLHCGPPSKRFLQSCVCFVYIN